MAVKLAWGCMFHGDDFIGVAALFTHIPIPPCGGKGFQDSMLVIGDRQDAVLRFIEHRIHMFSQDNRDGYHNVAITDRKVHRI